MERPAFRPVSMETGARVWVDGKGFGRFDEVGMSFFCLFSFNFLLIFLVVSPFCLYFPINKKKKT